MRILAQDNTELTSDSLDLTRGYLYQDRLFVAHHDAVPFTPEQYHYDIITYPNGGKDLKKVIEREAVTGKDAWDEYEEIQRYKAYTDEEYAALHANDNIPSADQRIAALEAGLVDMATLVAQLMSTATTVTDTTETPDTTATDTADTSSTNTANTEA